ncbi:MAG: ribonuclease R [Candidatus Aminicenantes bacterium]
MGSLSTARILSLLKKHEVGLSIERIRTELGVKVRERNKLLEEIRKLQQEGRLRFLRGRFLLPSGPGLVRGRFVTSRRGFGFVTPAGGGGDIFVPARFAEGVIQGDDVEVMVEAKGKFGKPEGKIVRVVKRERATLLGVYTERSGAPFLQAFDSPSPEDMPLKSRGRLAPRPGMIVEADRASLAVSRVYGFPEDPGVDSEIIIRRYALPARFSEGAEAEAAAVADGIPPRALEGRRDFRDWPSVTIDGEKAQDFDDAVSVRRLPDGGWLLGVHIADVSHYVRPGSALDRDAFERATSVYFPDLTLPMLPEKLSNGICSLRPAEPRLTFSVLMEVGADGLVRRSEFAPSIIRTAHRLTYSSVFRIFEGDEEETDKYADVVPALLTMKALAQALRARRLAEGSLDFDLVEPELVYEQGKLLAVAAAERNEAHRLIEEFMVAGNVAVASFFTRKKVPGLYRVHPVPGAADLEKLRDLLFRFGLALPEAGRVRSKDLQAVLEKARGRPEEKFIGIQVLRAMKLAVYAAENVGHYGLGKSDYTHFTSPIRRYPDLVVHRLLKKLLAGEQERELDLESVARHASDRERNAAEAEQALLEWRIFRFLKERLGDEFAGIVVDVAKAGLVVELDEYFVDGLLPFALLQGADAPRALNRKRPVRKRTKRFDLGDRVRVVLVSCDPVLRRMSFVPAPEQEAGPR